MSHAEKAAGALREVAIANAAGVRHAVEAFKADLRAFHDATDLSDVMRATAELILAAEELASRATATGKAARAILGATMAETGSPSFAIAGHAVVPRQSHPRPYVADPTLLPDEYWVQPSQPPLPPREPNMDLIAARLKARIEVPGVAMTNGGEPSVQIKARKDVTT